MVSEKKLARPVSLDTNLYLSLLDIPPNQFTTVWFGHDLGLRYKGILNKDN